MWQSIKVIIGAILVLISLFGLAFGLSALLFPEWLGLGKWETSLAIQIIAGGSYILVEGFLFWLISKIFDSKLVTEWLRFTFGKKYKEIEQSAMEFSIHQIEREKNSRKYIPDIFIETVDVKEKLRYFSTPFPFVYKILDKIKQDIDNSFFISTLRKIHYPVEQISLPRFWSKRKLNNKIQQVLEELDKAEEYKGILAEEGGGLKVEHLNQIPKNRRHYYDYHYAYLTPFFSFDRVTKNAKQNIRLLTETTILIISRAGRGKTNFVCDFTENHLLKKEKLSLYFSGRDFNQLGENESIEEAITRIVFSEEDISFSDLLAIVKFSRTLDYLFVVIDGINEHKNLPLFGQALEQFIQRSIEKNIKIILTCRSEYLSERFGRLLKLEGLTEFSIDEKQREIPPTHQKYLLENYFNHFQIQLVLDDIVPWLQKLFYEDKLLLRFFCEAYEGNRELHVIQSIYRFEIFEKYFTKKCDEIEGLEPCLAEIVSYMIENGTFIDIPLEEISAASKQILDNLFDESVILRKDLVDAPGLAFGKREVINFVYDEFREYLLSSSLLISWNKNPENTKTQIDELIQGSNPVAEGLLKYLCSWAIKEADEALLEHLESYDLFSIVFIENIFAVPDKDVSQELLEVLITVFYEHSHFSRDIVIHSISRCNPHTYPNLNMGFLIDLITQMEIEQYNIYIQQGLTEDYRYMEYICQSCIKAFDSEVVSEQSKPNVLRFLMCLTGVEDEDWLHRDNDLGRFPAISTIIDIAPNYSGDEISQIADGFISTIQIDHIREEVQSLFERLVG